MLYILHLRFTLYVLRFTFYVLPPQHPDLPKRIGDIDLVRLLADALVVVVQPLVPDTWARERDRGALRLARQVDGHHHDIAVLGPALVGQQLALVIGQYRLAVFALYLRLGCVRK